MGRLCVSIRRCTRSARMQDHSRFDVEFKWCSKSLMCAKKIFTTFYQQQQPEPKKKSRMDPWINVVNTKFWPYHLYRIWNLDSSDKAMFSNRLMSSLANICPLQPLPPVLSWQRNLLFACCSDQPLKGSRWIALLSYIVILVIATFLIVWTILAILCQTLSLTKQFHQQLLLIWFFFPPNSRDCCVWQSQEISSFWDVFWDIFSCVKKFEMTLKVCDSKYNFKVKKFYDFKKEINVMTLNKKYLYDSSLF